MGAIVLLALSLGLAVYGGLRTLPGFSPRQEMVGRLRPHPPAEKLSAGVIRGRRRVALACGAVLLATWPWLLLGRPVHPMRVIAALVLAALAETGWVRLQSFRRRVMLARAYPDLLAHLAVQTHAGASIVTAFASSPALLREPLRAEVEDLVADLRVAPVPDALERFARRCGLPQIHTFAVNLIHQQALGIALQEITAAEEEHATALLRQTYRRNVARAGTTVTVVTVVLLLNVLLILWLPLL